MTAQLVERTYHGSGRKFHTVECGECLTVLNSGHHYNEERHAQAAADQHNREAHP